MMMILFHFAVDLNRSDFTGRKTDDFKKDESTLLNLGRETQREGEMEKGDQSGMDYPTGDDGIGKSFVLSQAAKVIESAHHIKNATCHMSRFVFCEKDSFRPFRYDLARLFGPYSDASLFV